MKYLNNYINQNQLFNKKYLILGNIIKYIVYMLIINY